MHVVIFEGSRWSTFAPLSLGRPVFTLPTGMTSLLEKQLRHLKPSKLTLWVRPELAEFCRQRIVPTLRVPTDINVPLDNELTLLVSGRTLFFSNYRFPGEPAVATDESKLVTSAVVRMPGLSAADALNRTDKWMKIFDLPPMVTQSRLPTYLWDLINWNEESLVEDYATTATRSRAKPVGAYHMVDDEQVEIGEGVHLAPGVVLDASKGPVILDAHATIGANTVIQGPCYIAPYATIMPLSIIHGGTTIGRMCKVGGEVGNSIMAEFSNKAHHGYLGDSYVGKWVNLGAGTTTSNLKNTYGEISIHAGGQMVNSGRRFLGSVIGDHCKTAIDTRLMSGTYLGFCSMIACSSIPPKFVPSFTFLTDRGAEPYRLDKAMEVMKTVFARRNRGWESLDQQMVEYAARAAVDAEK